MDNQEFTQHFWNLSEKNSSEVIINSAEFIVEQLESKQKFSKIQEIKNKQKFKSYLNIFQNPSEDLLYSLNRLVISLEINLLKFQKFKNFRNKYFLL
jgi:hypothetical protein